jgi:hypothetical protein
MDCRDALNALLDRLNDLPAPRDGAALDAHLAGCASCRREAAALEDVWDRLGEDPEPLASSGFRARTLEMIEDAVSARRVVRFRPRPVLRTLAQAAAVLLAVSGAFLLGRLGRTRTEVASKPAAAESLAVVGERLVDASRTVPDLSSRPRLSNVAYRPADPQGRIGVSFDATTRYTVVGKPDQPALAGVLAYLVSGGDTEGARGKAIDLVAQHYDEKSAPPAPEIVRMLAATLKSDRNPGVRKKAAEALAQLTPTPEIRDALALALKGDANPAVRMAAVEGLAKAAERLKDESTIKTLREKASDEGENGYIRGQAALALNRIRL